MIKLKLADYFETKDLAEKAGVAVKLKTLAYKVFDGDNVKGYCVFSLQENVCILETVELNKEDISLADGLIKACIAYCFDHGAKYFSFAKGEDENIYLTPLFKGKQAEKPFDIQTVISHCH